MDESYPHLSLQREELITEKRKGSRPPPATPADPAAHARTLISKVEEAARQADTDLGGFDDRRLFRFEVAKGFNPDDLQRISAEIEFVSQEGDTVVAAFVSASALESFEARLASMAAGQAVTYRQVIYALQGVGGWSEGDRKGWALRQEGFPDTETFLLDVELWPVEAVPSERDLLWDAFHRWLADQSIEYLDGVRQPGLLLLRVRCDRAQAERLLRHRDVRTLDLPPRFGLDRRLLATDIQSVAPVPPPPDDAPAITVLDSGLATGHPLLAPAVGEAASFLPGKGDDDEAGHGTHIAGLALYGDMEQTLQASAFVPQLRLFSGRILDEHCESPDTFTENHITEAVHYFHDTYGCRVFNLSYGDLNKPYLGGHLRGLALTLDQLSRELGVLFVVSSGNVSRNALAGLDWKESYPEYLQCDAWSLIDPATALNAITVGGIARFDQSFASQRHRTDPAEVPIARPDQPSPFTRHGPTLGGAIKPELVAYGGNWALNTRGGAYCLVETGLGELSTSYGFATGTLLATQVGTSFAAPQVAHLAARLLVEHPDASANLLRCLLLLHARPPDASIGLIPDADVRRAIVGYGQIGAVALFRSSEHEVSLLAEEMIENKQHHFFELPIPDDFLTGGRREREIAVALAYTPAVRSTRIAYRATRIEFKLVVGDSLEQVSMMFSRATPDEVHKNIPEFGAPDCPAQVRSKGTVQRASWQFRQINTNAVLKNKRLFIVVTRNDHPWGEVLSDIEEAYALAVRISDRANDGARLYTQIRGQLRARQTARARARV